MASNFTATLPHPFYGDHVLYHAYNLWPSLPVLRAWEFGGWRTESMSCKTAAIFMPVCRALARYQSRVPRQRSISRASSSIA